MASILVAAVTAAAAAAAPAGCGPDCESCHNGQVLSWRAARAAASWSMALKQAGAAAEMTAAAATAR